MRENKQSIADAICTALKSTSQFGDPEGNPLDRMVYIVENGDEFVRPIFADGTGKDGYYDVCVSMDSGAAMFIDIAEQFVRKML